MLPASINLHIIRITRYWRIYISFFDYMHHNQLFTDYQNWYCSQIHWNFWCVFAWVLYSDQRPPAFVIAFFSFSLSLCNILHSKIKWSTVCWFWLHLHIGLSVILNRWQYALVFLCPVKNAVRFDVNLILEFVLSLMLGK